MYRTCKDMMLIASAFGTVAYVLFWLSRHSFMEQPHHYITALVIVGWIAVLPFLAFYHHERSKHHGYF